MRARRGDDEIVFFELPIDNRRQTEERSDGRLSAEFTTREQIGHLRFHRQPHVGIAKDFADAA